MRLVLAVLFASTAFAQGGGATPIDAAALEPVLTKSWSAGPGCNDDVIDFVIDTDGQPYLRAAGGFTPLAMFELKGDELTIADEVGIGRTTIIYRLMDDGSLRLWSEVFDESFGADPSDGAGSTTQRVKDGRTLIDDEGQAISPGVETPVLKACPLREALYPADVVAALEGVWATGDGKGGICAVGADSVTFQLTRPVPRVLRGPFGGAPFSTSYALGIAKDGASYIVTEGNAFEAGDFTFTPDGKGGLVQANPYADGPLELFRCP